MITGATLYTLYALLNIYSIVLVLDKYTAQKIKATGERRYTDLVAVTFITFTANLVRALYYAYILDKQRKGTEATQPSATAANVRNLQLFGFLVIALCWTVLSSHSYFIAWYWVLFECMTTCFVFWGVRD